MGTVTVAIPSSWKTAVFSLMTAVFGFILFSPEYFTSYPWVVSLAKYFAAGGLVGMGLSAKDYNVVGGTVDNGKTPGGTP